MYPRKLNFIEKFGNVVAKVLGWIYSTITIIWSIILYLPIIIVGLIFPPIVSLVFTFLIEMTQTTTELDEVRPYPKKIWKKFVQSLRTSWRQYVADIMTIVRSMKIKK